MSEETLRAALETLALEHPPSVTVSRDGQKLVAIVVSASFQGMDEAERQGLVWGHLQRQFEDHELIPLEFVFTNTPAEDEELAS
jgi:acid stress-induced BolA-like protein IbaG/YrbA